MVGQVDWGGLVGRRFVADAKVVFCLRNKVSDFDT